MKFEIKGPFRENIYTSMRRAGYPPTPSSRNKRKEKAQLEFARPARGYPRFHLFIKKQDDTLIFNLHLDQKKPVYQDVPAHAAEYNSEIIKKEVERIKQVLK